METVEYEYGRVSNDYDAQQVRKEITEDISQVLQAAAQGRHIPKPVRPKAFGPKHLQPNATLWPTSAIPSNRNTRPAEISLGTA